MTHIFPHPLLPLFLISGPPYCDEIALAPLQLGSFGRPLHRRSTIFDCGAYRHYSLHPDNARRYLGTSEIAFAIDDLICCHI